MDLIAAKPIVEAAIARSSQNLVARAIGIDPAGLSRWLRDKTEPKGKTKTSILQFAEERAYGSKKPIGRVREARTAATVEQAIQIAQHEQTKWIREFAARVLEASARELRAASADTALGAFVTAAELDGDDDKINEMQDQAIATPPVNLDKKGSNKRSTG